MKITIGPSTGWLYASGISQLNLHKQIINGTSSDAIEIHLRHNENVEEDLLNNNLSEYSHRSLHLPKVSANTTDELIEITKKLHNKHNYNYILLHPDTIENDEDWIKLQESGLPIAIENMDKRKKSGIKIDELKEIIEKYDFDLVFDLQHAYEQDKSMKYAEELFDTFKSKIVYLHVSGESIEGNHTLVKDSENQMEIVDFLKKIFTEINVPIILEGEYQGKDDLKEEVDFIKSELTH